MSKEKSVRYVKVHTALVRAGRPADVAHKAATAACGKKKPR